MAKSRVVNIYYLVSTPFLETVPSTTVLLMMLLQLYIILLSTVRQISVLHLMPAETSTGVGSWIRLGASGIFGVGTRGKCQNGPFLVGETVKCKIWDLQVFMFF